MFRAHYSAQFEDIGVFKLRTDRKPKTLQEVLILIADRSMYNVDRDLVTQRLILLRGFKWVAEIEFRASRDYLSLGCGSVNLHTEHVGASSIKLLNWPELELVGPSKTLAEKAYDILTGDCESLPGSTQYEAVTAPATFTINPNNEKRIYFATSGVPCATPCQAPREIDQDNAGSVGEFKCHTGEYMEPCTEEFFLPIDRQLYELSHNATSPDYTAIAIQYCGAEYSRVHYLTANDLRTEEIFDCNFSGNLQSLSHVLLCPNSLSMDLLMSEMIDFNCELVAKDSKFIPNGLHSLSIMKLRPRIAYETLLDVSPSYAGYTSAMPERVCPLGHRLELIDTRFAKFVDRPHNTMDLDTGELALLENFIERTNQKSEIIRVPYACHPCPENTFNDHLDNPYICRNCPYSRPSTYGLSGAVSSQCSNDRLNKAREHILRYGKHLPDPGEQALQNYTFEADAWWKPHYPDDDLEHLNYLYPDRTYLKQQREAVAVFKALTPLTFSSNELLLMMGIASAIALFGIVTGLLILITVTQRPPKCTLNQIYGPYPNWSERINVQVYCTFRNLLLRIISIFQQIQPCILDKMGQIWKNFRESRPSLTTLEFGRRLSDEIKRRTEQYNEPTDIDEQTGIIHLLTQTTLNRIVEQAMIDFGRRRIIKRRLYAEYLQYWNEAVLAKAKAREAETILTGKNLSRILEPQSELANIQERTSTVRQLDDAGRHSERMSGLAEQLQSMAKHRLTELIRFRKAEFLQDELASRGLSIEDRRAVDCAAPELRAYLRLPRYHSPAFFFMHPSRDEEVRRRETKFPTPERE
ncbi:hypothetical protein EG68_07868 [Paragonimus skrjabini miyazakii]|uniref:Uncharacterized protein n=1 Tax=Paragonimus skrjabini miyazakii TaxID=59628 RepID=A0A8S9Y907_9TREM|nr:hypothetical protein EG68_07868 [Paragonimus skrjabini miyazakii]